MPFFITLKTLPNNSKTNFVSYTLYLPRRKTQGHFENLPQQQNIKATNAGQKDFTKKGTKKWNKERNNRACKLLRLSHNYEH